MIDLGNFNVIYNSQGRWEDKEYLVFRDQEVQRGQGDKRERKVRYSFFSASVKYACAPGSK